MSLKQHDLGNGLILVHDSEKGVICLANPEGDGLGYRFEFYNQQFESACLCTGCFNNLAIDLKTLSSILMDYLFQSVDLSFILYITDSSFCKQLKYRLTGTVQVEVFNGYF